MPTYPVIQPLKHNGQSYAPGDAAEMDAKAAKDLLLLGVLGPATKVAAKETKASPPQKLTKSAATGGDETTASTGATEEGK